MIQQRTVRGPHLSVENRIFDRAPKGNVSIDRVAEKPMLLGAISKIASARSWAARFETVWDWPRLYFGNACQWSKWTEFLDWKTSWSARICQACLQSCYRHWSVLHQTKFLNSWLEVFDTARVEIAAFWILVTEQSASSWRAMCCSSASTCVISARALSSSLVIHGRLFDSTSISSGTLQVLS